MNTWEMGKYDRLAMLEKAASGSLTYHLGHHCGNLYCLTSPLSCTELQDMLTFSVKLSYGLYFSQVG